MFLVNCSEQRAAVANDSRRVCARLYRKRRARICISAKQIHNETNTGVNPLLITKSERAPSCKDEGAREVNDGTVTQCCAVLTRLPLISPAVPRDLSQRITKSIAAAACASSAVASALRTHTVTRPPAFAAVGVHVNVLELVQVLTGTQASPL